MRASSLTLNRANCIETMVAMSCLFRKYLRIDRLTEADLIKLLHIYREEHESGKDAALKLI